MEDKSILHIIPIIWQHRKVILIPVIFAIIASSVILLLMPNYYESSATFYPVNSSLLEPSVQINTRSIDYFGDDQDVDRILSIARSGELIQEVIDEFNLKEHYGISSSGKKGRIQLVKRFKKLFKVIKTEYDAVELSIEDQDPAMARNLVAAVVRKIDLKLKSIIQGAQQNLLENLQSSYNANEQEIIRLSDSLKVLRQQYGIYDSESQAEVLSNMELRSPGNASVQRRIANYSAGISQVKNLEALLLELNEGIADDVLQIRQIEASLSTDRSSIHMIEAPFEPLEKSRPKRSLYVLGIAALTGFFMILMILIRESMSSQAEETA